MRKLVYDCGYCYKARAKQDIEEERRHITIVNHCPPAARVRMTSIGGALGNDASKTAVAQAHHYLNLHTIKAFRSQYICLQGGKEVMFPTYLPPKVVA